MYSYWYLRSSESKIKSCKILPDPPVVEVKTDSIHSPVDKAVEFRCSVHGQPQPTQSWYKMDGNNQRQPIRQGGGYQLRPGHHTSTLHIERVKQGDYGTYICYATNAFNQWGNATILLTGKSVFPKNIMPQNLGII